jgi:D-alanine-D-alanine ligase
VDSKHSPLNAPAEPEGNSSEIIQGSMFGRVDARLTGTDGLLSNQAEAVRVWACWPVVEAKAYKIGHWRIFMDFHPIKTSLPVLMLYNLNPEWSLEDIDESRKVMQTLAGAMREEGHPVTEVCLENKDLSGLLRPFSPDNTIIFNWCEEIPGIPHSYDLIAQTLEELGFTFTGADSKALSFSQDKRLVKQRLDDRSIGTPRWQIFPSTSGDGWMHFPAIVKPALDHCSLGVTREAVVWSAEALASRIEYIIDSFHGPALVEEFIDGREFHVTVVGNGRLHVLPIAEMDFSAFDDTNDRLCTYESKFNPQSRAYKLIKLCLPAQLTNEEEEGLTKIALEGFRAADCRDYARLDIRLRNGICYILDINPNADISPDTSPALAAERAGLTYGKFGSLLVNLASRRHPIFGLPVKEGAILEQVLS